MSAATCPVCKQLRRTFKPAEWLEGVEPDRFERHFVRGFPCPGGGRLVPLVAARQKDVS